MAFNPYSRRPVEREVKSKTFTDGDDSFTLTFKKPGQIEKCAAVDTGNELVKRYLDSGLGWPPIGGKVVRITPMSVQNAALYAEMQPGDAQERYTVEEFVAFQAVLSDETWEQVSAFIVEVMTGSDPTPSGADTATPSESASGTPSGTPN